MPPRPRPEDGISERRIRRSHKEPDQEDEQYQARKMQEGNGDEHKVVEPGRSVIPPLPSPLDAAYDQEKPRKVRGVGVHHRILVETAAPMWWKQ